MRNILYFIEQLYIYNHKYIIRIIKGDDRYCKSKIL